MITAHPARYNDFGMAWCKELIGQKIKNTVKRIIVKRNDSKSYD